MRSVKLSRQAADTRARLLEAAKQLFEERGFLASPVADIVARAGVAHGTFYRYFQSREDILRELAEEADARLNAPMREVILRSDRATPPVERIENAIRAFLIAYRSQAKIMGVVEEVSRYDVQLRDARHRRLRRYIDELAGSIQALQQNGLADTTLDPVVTSAVLGSITSRFPEMWLVYEIMNCSLDDAVEHISKIFIRSLGLQETPPAAARKTRRTKA